MLNLFEDLIRIFNYKKFAREVTFRYNRDDNSHTHTLLLPYYAYVKFSSYVAARTEKLDNGLKLKSQLRIVQTCVAMRQLFETCSTARNCILFDNI